MPTYTVKCDRCHADIRETEDLRASAAGGVCVVCTTVEQVIAAREMGARRAAVLLRLSPTSVRFHFRQRGGAENVDVTLDEGLDLYEVRVHRVRGVDVETTYEASHLYADQMARVVWGRAGR